MVPCLLGITATSTSRWLDSIDESEDEDVLFGGDPADPGPEAGDDDDGNLAEPWTVAQSQEARADAGCTDLEAALAAVAATKRWWRRLRRGARGPRRGCSRL